MDDLETYIDDFIAHIRIEKNYSEATTDTYRIALTIFSQFLLDANIAITDRKCILRFINHLKEKGNRVINIMGARTKNHIIWEDRFNQVSNKLILCTDDGSKGFKGLVTKPFEKLVRSQYLNRVIAIGPPLMMKEVARLTYQRTRAFVHLAPIMVDGIGMCGGCRVKVGRETKFACVDGPEFDAHEVDFDSFIYRNSRYTAEEKVSHKKHHISCIKKAADKNRKKAAKNKDGKKDVKKRVIRQKIKKR